MCPLKKNLGTNNKVVIMKQAGGCERSHASRTVRSIAINSSAKKVRSSNFNRLSETGHVLGVSIKCDTIISAPHTFTPFYPALLSSFYNRVHLRCQKSYQRCYFSAPSGEGFYTHKKRVDRGAKMQIREFQALRGGR